jgi:RNA polymerase sigma factor (TIGR02999 family)
MASPDQPAPAGRTGTITDRLLELRDGGDAARDGLFALVYDQLRGIAHNALRGERTDHTLGTTGLVHEAYLKLVDQTRVEWTDRKQFFAVASLAMRRILVDYARRYATEKRGGSQRPVTLDEDVMSVDDRADTLVALDEALDRLAKLDARLVRMVECRFFAGLTEEETAEVLGVTARTVRRDWEGEGVALPGAWGGEAGGRVTDLGAGERGRWRSHQRFRARHSCSGCY